MVVIAFPALDELVKAVDRDGTWEVEENLRQAHAPGRYQRMSIVPVQYTAPTVLLKGHGYCDEKPPLQVTIGRIESAPYFGDRKLGVQDYLIAEQLADMMGNQRGMVLRVSDNGVYFFIPTDKDNDPERVATCIRTVKDVGEQLKQIFEHTAQEIVRMQGQYTDGV